MVLPVGISDVREAADLAHRGWRGLAGRLRADHQTILTRTGLGTGRFGDGFFVGVAIAPSRTIRPLAPKEFAGRAIDFVKAGWPGELDGTVSSSGPDRIRFEARDDEDALTLVVEVRPTGLAETMTRVTPHELDTGVHLDLVEVLRPVAELHRTLGLRPLLQGRGRRRTDWYFNLSTTHAPRDADAVTWAGLILPGTVAPQRAKNAYPVAPVPGYAWDSLKGWSRRKPAVELMTCMAEDLLVQNGYVMFGEAPEEASRQALE